MEYLVLKLPMPSDAIDDFLAGGDVARLDMEARISRELTGDDNAYEGLVVSRELPGKAPDSTAMEKKLQETQRELDAYKERTQSDSMLARCAENAKLAAQFLAERDAMEKRKDDAYLERNRVVALMARMALFMGQRVGIKRTAIEGWSPDWHNCVYIDLPGVGQVSWHYHDSHAFLFNDLPPYYGEWDGHDTPAKYARVRIAYPVLCNHGYFPSECTACSRREP